MSIEIERKFLVNNLDFLNKIKGEIYIQAYFLKSEGKVLRIRVTETKAFLTIKQSQTQLSRLEFEYEIPIQDAKILIENSESHPIEKRRYKVLHLGHLWEIDVFESKNKGLVIAEIELESENESFEKPEWLGEEVSHDSRYFNSHLSEHPFCTW